ncbi:ATP phosphoribosyltransferase [Bosea sp. TAB14]|uniref:ATP phosphoribosyltransferase n=1 Tax=Bosea sp. TAB14 TaxID=3237481 RepID=UPI003F8EE7C4
MTQAPQANDAPLVLAVPSKGRLQENATAFFGRAGLKFVKASGERGYDVRSMADLEDVASTMRARHGRKLRVATKYVNLTRRFFAEHGLADYRIVESLGATEGAPAAGTAEIVVDITTTGATLAANALKVLDDGVMLASEANLVASTRAPWGDRARAAARTILSRIAAEEEARTVREIRARLDLDASALAALTERFGARLPFGAPAAGAPLTLHCPDKAVFALVEELDRKGADDITVTAPTYVFRRANRLLERLDARI